MQTMRVIIVEEEQAIIDTLTISLQRTGSTVWSTNSFVRGIDLVRALGENADAFLIDAHFPDGDGLKLAIETKKLHGNCLVVLMSGGLKQSRITEATREGIIFLPKPFDWPKVKQILCL